MVITVALINDFFIIKSFEIRFSGISCFETFEEEKPSKNVAERFAETEVDRRRDERSGGGVRRREGGRQTHGRLRERAVPPQVERIQSRGQHLVTMLYNVYHRLQPQ